MFKKLFIAICIGFIPFSVLASGNILCRGNDTLSSDCLNICEEKYIDLINKVAQKYIKNAMKEKKITKDEAKEEARIYIMKKMPYSAFKANFQLCGESLKKYEEAKNCLLNSMSLEMQFR